MDILSTLQESRERARNKARMHQELQSRIMNEIRAELQALALEEAAEEIQSSHYRGWLYARAKAVRAGVEGHPSR